MAFDWNNATTKKPEERISLTLPEGDYDFTVVEAVKDYYQAKEGSKIPSCDMYVVTLIVKNPDDGISQQVFDRFYFDEEGKNAWKVDQFAAAIGCPEGIPYSKMFANAADETGRCKIKPNGDYNNVKKYYPRKEW